MVCPDIGRRHAVKLTWLQESDSDLEKHIMHALLRAKWPQCQDVMMPTAGRSADTCHKWQQTAVLQLKQLLYGCDKDAMQEM